MTTSELLIEESDEDGSENSVCMGKPSNEEMRRHWIFYERKNLERIMTANSLSIN